MEVIQFKQKFPKSQTMAYKISIFIALLGIYSGLFADAKDKCETELDKEYLKGRAPSYNDTCLLPTPYICPRGLF
jgi:hypothetical protein